MHAAARLRQHARLRLRAYPCSALQLLEKRFEGAAPVEGAVRLVTAAHARERRLEARVIEWLQQVVHRAHLERFQRILIVSGHEHDERQSERVERARQREPRHGVHLDVEEQQLRGLLADGLQGGARIPVLADHLQVRLALAALAHAAPRPRLIVDDHHLHHSAARVAGRAAAPSGPSRSSGM